ncbi:MAG: VWA domain-containing protein [Planctomycetota bacterium]|nr:MAG: VWA domain-containing protein [Planctomycetota bacterium]
MTIDTNDPRLTAYALNELEDAERAEMERLLTESPEARAEVEAIRGAADRLSQELAAEPIPGTAPHSAEANMPGEAGHSLRLSDEDRRQIEARALAIRIRRWIPTAIAASVLLVCGLSISMYGMGSARDKARSDSNTNMIAMKDASGPDATDSIDPLSELRALGYVGEGLVRDASDPLPKVSGGAQKVDSGEPGIDQYALIRQNNTTPKQFLNPLTTENVRASSPASEQIAWMDARPNVTVPAFSGRSMNLVDNVSRDSIDVWWNRPRHGHLYHSENTGEAYNRILDNPFLAALQNPLSTFSIDVDTASYSNIRRMLTGNQLPPPDAVRIEEMVNYFTFDYDGPAGDHPFAVHLETAACPWDVEHRLVRVGLKGREIEREKRPACNLVFLIDVSGSMDEPIKLPLVKQALAMLTQQLTPADRVAMVVYAGASGLALPSTPAGEKLKILDALDNLQAGGSTNGGQGIELAYDIATQYLNKEGVNRVILATDGDFNVGITDREKLIKLITDKAKGGVFLSVLGFGMGNLKDATLEQLADKGNGHYAYIDTFAEAKKVLVDEIGATLVTIAKDVKIQIEFNPAQVAAYRLIGYENRILAARDFNDDKKDAGEIGAGHTVTALYEIVPMAANVRGVDPLKYQKVEPVSNKGSGERDPAGGEMLTVKLRYKPPTADTSTLIEVSLVDSGAAFDGASPDLRFAASVAGFGMMLRCSPHKGDLTYESVIAMAVSALGRDPNGQRSEFIDLVRKAKTLSGRE